jgi:predicted signal transduction protein with EAL and GGDEF domain
VIAGRIASLCRPSDEIIRFGGDEFLVLQAGATREGTDALAARLIRTIAEPVQINGDRVFVGASIGIVNCSEEIESSNECLRRADLALYEAKEAGRNCWRHFMPAMDRQLRDRETMRVRLHDALVGGAIQMHYQPQVDGSGQVIGLEALARWTDDDRRAVPPASFVQVAEETGLIDTLGFYAMRQAFHDSRRWPGLKIAINVSAVQLRSKSFVEDIVVLVNEMGVDPKQFELEITERLLLADDSRTLTMLKSLRSMGFRIALDDFGTGYSSLGYLQRYPIDCIKIDRSFILRIDRDAQAQSVVVAIVQLARALNLEVIAEGVENEAQRECLKAAGCHDMQGFLLGRPVAAEKIADQLQRRLAV